MTYQVKRGNKFGAKSTIYNGRSYHSKKEAEVAMQLDMARKATHEKDRVVDIIPQFSITFYIDRDGILTDEYSDGAYKICAYRPDFLVTYADEHKELIEVKGFWTTDARFKWRLTEALYSIKYPEIQLTVIN